MRSSDSAARALFAGSRSHTLTVTRSFAAVTLVRPRSPVQPSDVRPTIAVLEAKLFWFRLRGCCDRVWKTSSRRFISCCSLTKGPTRNAVAPSLGPAPQDCAACGSSEQGH
jgi:hypothetical protein